MTQTGYSSALVNVMLGWLKGLANWVLKLFNLAGSGGSPLLWLSDNWMKLLILFLALGLAMDWLVWMIRWRPYWVWFRKKRIVVNDERFLSGSYGELDDDDEGLDRQYVVPSTIVRRKPAAQKQAESRRTETKSGRVATTVRPAQKRRVNASARTVGPRTVRPIRTAKKTPQHDRFADELFEVGHSEQEYSDFYEDEVFNVSNLPDRSEQLKRNRKRQR